MDEWSQIVAVHILLFYARKHFKKPKGFDHIEPMKQPVSIQKNEEMVDDVFESKAQEESDIDEDLELLLKETDYLFLSRNPAVVLATTALFFHLAPFQLFLQKAVDPLLRLMSSSADIQYIVLQYILFIAALEPNYLLQYFSVFYLSSRDVSYVREMKLRVLRFITLKATVEQLEPHTSKLMAELNFYLQTEENKLASAVADIFGILGERCLSWSALCVKVLARIASQSTSNVIVSKVMSVLRHLIQKNPSEYSHILCQLCLLLMENKIAASTAKTHVIWLVGEYRKLLPYKLPIEIFRICCKSYVNESNEVKLQTMILGAKLVACSQNKPSLVNGSQQQLDSKEFHFDYCHQLLEYIIQVSKYDADYDVRDQARLFEVLFVKDQNSFLYKVATEAIVMEKPASSLTKQEESDIEQKKEWREKWSSVTKAKELRSVEPQGRKTSAGSEQIFERTASRVEEFYDSNEETALQSYFEEDEDVETQEEDESYTSDSKTESSATGTEEDMNFLGEEGSMLSSNEPAPRKPTVSLIESIEGDIFSIEPKVSNNVKSQSLDLVSELGSMWPSKESLRARSKKNWKRLVDSWNCAGLEIDYYVSKHASVYGLDVGIICLLVRNNNSYAVNNIQIVASATGLGEETPELISSDSPFSLDPMECKEVAIHVKFKGRPEKMLLEIICNGERSSIVWKPTVGEILRPEVISETDFLKKRSSMSGMLQMETVIQPPDCKTSSNLEDKCLEEILEELITSKVNANRIHFTLPKNQPGQEKELSFCGRIRGNEKLVFITISLNVCEWKTKGFKLVVNSEDVVIGSSLLHYLKKETRDGLFKS
eukprot:jgi/Galph1/3749/GphlegSOOS_G2439.1